MSARSSKNRMHRELIVPAKHLTVQLQIWNNRSPALQGFRSKDSNVCTEETDKLLALVDLGYTCVRSMAHNVCRVSSASTATRRSRLARSITAPGKTGGHSRLLGQYRVKCRSWTNACEATCRRRVACGILALSSIRKSNSTTISSPRGQWNSWE